MRAQVVVNLAIECKLVIRQGQPCEQRVFFEQEVAHRCLREQVALRQLTHLCHPLKEEEELRGQRISGAVAIEALEEGVGLRLFEHWLCPEAVGEPAGERGLAHTDRAFDHDMSPAVERVHADVSGIGSQGWSATCARH